MCPSTHPQFQECFGTSACVQSEAGSGCCAFPPRKHVDDVGLEGGGGSSHLQLAEQLRLRLRVAEQQAQCQSRMRQKHSEEPPRLLRPRHLPPRAEPQSQHP